MSQVENSPLLFTENAALKVYQLIQEEGNFNLNLRVFITGGGCSGLQYGFTFDDQINPDDTVIEKKIIKPIESVNEHNNKGGEGDNSFVPIKLLIDPMSYPYLMGAEIDYKEDIEGARFVIRNPNAQTTCGCGSSFSAE
jgi:iron-sulfur cluster insertion protein